MARVLCRGAACVRKTGTNPPGQAQEGGNLPREQSSILSEHGFPLKLAILDRLVKLGHTFGVGERTSLGDVDICSAAPTLPWSFGMVA